MRRGTHLREVTASHGAKRETRKKREREGWGERDVREILERRAERRIENARFGARLIGAQLPFLEIDDYQGRTHPYGASWRRNESTTRGKIGSTDSARCQGSRSVGHRRCAALRCAGIGIEQRLFLPLRCNHKNLSSHWPY